MYAEKDFLPLSALQHIVHCPRRCALVYIEQSWAENFFTAEGGIIHAHAHQQEKENRPDLRISRGVPLHSRKLGLSGIADIVEFHQTRGKGAKITDSQHLWKVVPVEYKRGKAKTIHSYTIQLCAQGICLEEMMNIEIECGALYSGLTRKRIPVIFSKGLREETIIAARQLHSLFESRRTPPPERGPKCDSCSMKNICLPNAFRKQKVSSYLEKIFKEMDEPTI